ncbi:hypothetical protein LMK08_20330 [Metapseudomonas furukawaii]|uniref:hypothetical protein n=1 Tax=Metapseudomonas furukawaii TaxID=1149133 RepID=UPI00227C74EC|nr:hypothetical protein [Pseudomonas furukawaii]WAG77689.1 hypothetical protein LMK08_20330 [Pseudomonas furukawaii]
MGVLLDDFEKHFRASAEEYGLHVSGVMFLPSVGDSPVLYFFVHEKDKRYVWAGHNLAWI